MMHGPIHTKFIFTVCIVFLHFRSSIFETKVEKQ